LFNSLIDEIADVFPLGKKREQPKLSIDADSSNQDLFDEFLLAHDAHDDTKALKISDILFSLHNIDKVKQELKPIHFYQFLLLRIEYLLSA
jgi:hypothetical protein